MIGAVLIFLAGIAAAVLGRRGGSRAVAGVSVNTRIRPSAIALGVLLVRLLSSCSVRYEPTPLPTPAASSSPTTPSLEQRSGEL